MPFIQWDYRDFVPGSGCLILLAFLIIKEMPFIAYSTLIYLILYTKTIHSPMGLHLLPKILENEKYSPCSGVSRTIYMKT